MGRTIVGMSTPAPRPFPVPDAAAGRKPGLAVTIALYALARLALVAVVAGLLALAGVPIILAVLLGLIVALPLSMVLFRGMRVRLDTAIAVAGARRSAERDALRARLRGEEPDPGRHGPSDDHAQR